MSPSKSIVINVPPMSSMNKPAESAPTAVSDMTTPPAMAVEQQQLKPKKRANVTITVLSIAGLFVKDGAAKKRSLGLTKKFSSRGNNLNEAASDIDTSSRTASTITSSATLSNNESAAATTIVASFSRVVNTKDGKPKAAMTHVPSLPLPFPSTSAHGRRAVNDDTMTSVVHWPESNQDIASISTSKNAASSGRVLSSYQFQHTFQREQQGAATGPDDTPDRFVPKPLSIQIAISRSGRMFKLGTADILLSGEETVESSINVPIKNLNPAIPKSSTTSKTKSFKNRAKSSAGDKMIPMMKLKGDTLKCGLDPSATLRVLIHVSEPIGETIEISPNLSVTMISKTSTPTPPLAQMNADQVPKIEQQPSEVSWEYNPTLAAVVVKNPKKEKETAVPITNKTEDNDAEQLVRVLTLQDDTVHVDDEPSCSSSAYMSDFGYHSRHPSKGLSTARSYSTRSTMTASSASTDFSDLTDSRSWFSQTGIEVIPFTPDRSPSQIHILANSRLRSLSSEGFTVDESRNTSLLDEETDHGESTTTFLHRVKKKKSWKQRFSCNLPICGASAFNGSGDVEEDVLSVLHEDHNDAISAGKYGIVGRCSDFGGGNPMEIQHSYYTDDGEDEEDDSSTDGEAEEEEDYDENEDGYDSNAASSMISL